MESLRNQALQRELVRIETEARENSIAALRVASALEAAEQLCVLINGGLEADKGVEPKVVYYGDSRADVVIYTHGREIEVLDRAAEVEIEWKISGIHGTEAYRSLSFSGFDGAHVIVKNEALAHYQAGLAIIKAAA